MTELELLVKNWEETKTEVVMLEQEEEEGKYLYQTSHQYMYKWNYYRTTPVFQVFHKGKRILATESYRMAYGKYASI